MNTRLTTADAEAGVTVQQASQPEVIEQARRLQATVYLQRRYITQEDVIGGVMSPRVDPWVANSVYFVARDPAGVVLGVIRLILWGSPDSLPALRHGFIWPAHKEYIETLLPAVAEVSALAVARGAPGGIAVQLYRAIWHYGRRHHHKMWLMLIDPPMRSLLHALLGPVTYAVGDPRWYMGGHLLPVALRTCDTHSIISDFEQRHDRAGLAELFPHNSAWDMVPRVPPAPAPTPSGMSASEGRWAPRDRGKR